MTTKPLISILMPVYNPPLPFLKAAINSVLNQSYPHWELCIADDCSDQSTTRPYLESLAASDPRIKVVFREKNGHISACSNSALELASGPYTGLLDQDDELDRDALFWVAQALMRSGNVDLIYSDEDKIDEFGNRFDPYFKCEFNYELFLAQNMISHFGVYRTALVRQVGGFRLGLEGSQDHDLALRVFEQSTPENIIHIPRVLYHWRALEGS
ncbi:MAG: glycosyltransferase family 2 protein, partial [Hyphomonadaceae bacterium]